MDTVNDSPMCTEKTATTVLIVSTFTVFVQVGQGRPLSGHDDVLSCPATIGW